MEAIQSGAANKGATCGQTYVHVSDPWQLSRTAGFACFPAADQAGHERCAGRFSLAIWSGAVNVSLRPTPAEARALAAALLKHAADAERFPLAVEGGQ